MYNIPRLRKANSQPYTVLQLRLHFQSPLLADHILPVSCTAPVLVLTCPSRSLFSSGLSSEAASPSLLEAIENLLVVAQDSRFSKTHHTHTRFSLQKWKNYTWRRFLWNTLGKDLVLFETSLLDFPGFKHRAPQVIQPRVRSWSVVSPPVFNFSPSHRLCSVVKGSTNRH